MFSGRLELMNVLNPREVGPLSGVKPSLDHWIPDGFLFDSQDGRKKPQGGISVFSFHSTSEQRCLWRSPSEEALFTRADMGKPSSSIRWKDTLAAAFRRSP